MMTSTVKRVIIIPKLAKFYAHNNWLIWLTRFNATVIVILGVKTNLSTMASWQEVSPNKCDADVQPEVSIAAYTGNANIFGIITDRIEIPTASLCFSTAVSSKKLFADDWYYDRYRKWQWEGRNRKWFYAMRQSSNSDGECGHSIMASSKKVFPGDCDNHRHLKIPIWPPNRKYLYLWNYLGWDRNSNGKCRVLITVSSIKVCSSNCDDVRQPEMEL